MITPLNMDALYRLYPQIKSTAGNIAYDVNGNEVVVDFALVDAEVFATQYQRDRAKEYPSIQEQLDMQYWDAINGTTVWQDTINAIKAKYPKVG